MDSPFLRSLAGVDLVVLVVGLLVFGVVVRLVVGFLQEVLARLAWFGRLPPGEVRLSRRGGRLWF